MDNVNIASYNAVVYSQDIENPDRLIPLHPRLFVESSVSVVPKVTEDVSAPVCFGLICSLLIYSSTSQYLLVMTTQSIPLLTCQQPRNQRKHRNYNGEVQLIPFVALDVHGSGIP